MSNAELKLKELGLELPQPIKPVGTYYPYRRSGKLLYISGQGPIWNGKFHYLGKIGKELTKEEGYEAARMTGLNILAQIKAATGDLDSVSKFLSVIGFVNCVDDFVEHPYVIDGFSNLMISVYGEAGYHSRCAVPSGTLPMNTSVEIQSIIELK